ncbi:MAG: hypothetical protein GX595_07005 [Lentisphaerae bacterium]|nr:hypothetical protein [Lentisphaerota bacterium]
MVTTARRVLCLAVIGLSAAWAQPAPGPRPGPGADPLPGPGPEQRRRPAPPPGEAPPAWGQPGPGAEAPEGGPRPGQPGGPLRRREGAATMAPAEFMERLRQERPEEHERLSRLYREDPKRFFQETQALVREMGVQLGAAHPAGARLRRESPEEQACLDLSRRFREAADPAAQAQLKTELAAAIETAFEARLKASKERIARLEKQLLEVREKLQRLEANREAICAERLQDLTQPDDLRWDGNW